MFRGSSVNSAYMDDDSETRKLQIFTRNKNAPDGYGSSGVPQILIVLSDSSHGHHDVLLLSGLEKAPAEVFLCHFLLM